MALETGVRRRGTLQQGRALEMLGHAVEYLIDQRLFTSDEQERLNDREAGQIMMQCSRAVFLECPQVVPIRRRLAAWCSARLRDPGMPQCARSFNTDL